MCLIWKCNYMRDTTPPSRREKNAHTPRIEEERCTLKPSAAHLTVISLLDMKCNLRKSLLRFMLMLALSLGTWNVRQWFSFRVFRSQLGKESSRARARNVVMHIDRHMQSTDVPLYYICNFKLVLRHYLFIVQSLLRHYICWTHSVLGLGFDGSVDDGGRRKSEYELTNKQGNLSTEGPWRQVESQQKKPLSKHRWYTTARPMIVPSLPHTLCASQRERENPKLMNIWVSPLWMTPHFLAHISQWINTRKWVEREKK